MSRISNVEDELVEQVTGNEGPSADALDTLLGALLSLVPGFSPRASDGVLMQHEERSGLSYFGAGIAILVSGQLVEPVAFDFTVNSDGGALSVGTVMFGRPKGPDACYGSPEHGKISKSILLNPRGNREWRYVFNRTVNGWIVSDPGPTP